MILYHGTSYNSSRSIKKFGFGNSLASYDTIWNVSENKKSYFVAVDRFGSNEECLEFALQAGCVASAYEGSTTGTIAVFKLECSDELFEGYFYDDMSCENMEGCYQISSATLNDLIETEKIKCTLEFHCGYMPDLRPFYLANLNLDLLNIADDARIMEAIQYVSDKNDGMIYEAFPPNLTPYKTKEVRLEKRKWLLKQKKYV